VDHQILVGDYNCKCYRQLVLLTIWNAVAAAVAGFAYQTDIDY
jgi:hypothetical protein